MERWFETYWGERIQAVSVQSSTATHVVLGNGDKVKKLGKIHSYFPTWQEAKEQLVSIAESELLTAKGDLTLARRNLDVAVSKLSRIKKMEEEK